MMKLYHMTSGVAALEGTPVAVTMRAFHNNQNNFHALSLRVRHCFSFLTTTFTAYRIASHQKRDGLIASVFALRHARTIATSCGEASVRDVYEKPGGCSMRRKSKEMKTTRRADANRMKYRFAQRLCSQLGSGCRTPSPVTLAKATPCHDARTI
jgi:hypothetical protein